MAQITWQRLTPTINPRPSSPTASSAPTKASDGMGTRGGLIVRRQEDGIAGGLCG